MNLLKLARMANQIKLNTPTKNCPDCINAQESLLFLANSKNEEVDVTKILMICSSCGQSIWAIEKRKGMPLKVKE